MLPLIDAPAVAPPPGVTRTSKVSPPHVSSPMTCSRPFPLGTVAIAGVTATIAAASAASTKVSRLMVFLLPALTGGRSSGGVSYR